MSSRTHMTALKNMIADALANQGYEHPRFTINGEPNGKKMSNRQIRAIARNLGVSMKMNEALFALKNRNGIMDDVEEPADDKPAPIP